MPRLVWMTIFGFALSSAVQAQPAQLPVQTNEPHKLDASQKQLVSQLIAEWKEYFSSISTLDIQWKWVDLLAGSNAKSVYNYHFWRGPGRYRLDTAFHPVKSNPRFYKSFAVLGEAGSVKSLRIDGLGNAGLTAPYADRPLNPYSASIPLLEAFYFAKDSQSTLTLEGFGSDSFWQRFASRVQKVETGSWEKRRGWWLTVTNHTSKEGSGQDDRTVRVFIDGATFFPFLTSGNMRHTSKEYSSQSAYNIRVVQTQTWMVNGKTRLLPLDSISQGWRHNLSTGERSTQLSAENSTAPIKINAPITGQCWKLAIPAKTLVDYALKPQPKFNEYRIFLYDPQGGALWVQQNKELGRQVSSLRRYRAMPIIYDEKADGEAQIAAALEMAAAQSKNVLLQFGAYWCPPCHTLHNLLSGDKVLAPLVKDNYIYLPIDLNGGHNAAVAKRLMGRGQGGLPFLIILDAQGKRIAAPPSEYFSPKSGDKPFDDAKLVAFLDRWKPQRS